MRRMTVAIGLVLLLVVAVSCSSDGASVDSGAAGAPTVKALDGRTFLSTSVQVGGVDRPMATARPTITLEFRSDVLSASSGCNGTGGSYSLDGDHLTMGDLSSTAMACAEPGLMEQDAWFSALLESGPTLVLAGDQLTMTSGDTVIVFVDRETADPDRPLIGTAWTLESIISGQTASSVPIGVTATLSIPNAGTITWQACNRSGGRVESMDTSTFTVGDGDSTLMACPGPAGDVDRAMNAVLKGAVSYETEGPVLRLRNGDHGLDFRAP